MSMKDKMNHKSMNLNKLLNFKPQVSNINNSLVDIYTSEELSFGPIIFKANNHHVLLHEWMKNNDILIQDYLLKHGAVLFRNFNSHGVSSFRDVVNSYDLGAAKRTKIIDSIYLSTHHPADENLEMHNEMSYTANWPTQIIFSCQIPPLEGGETPLADSRKILNLLSDKIRQKFEDLGIMYVRRLGGALGGLSWQDVFKTSDRRLVEEKCNQDHIGFEWVSDDILKMKWILPAKQIHPISGEAVWFNHAFFFNSIMLNSAVYATLKTTEMPFEAFYGDGTEIEISTLKEIDEVFKKVKTKFKWEKGDLLILVAMFK